MENQEQQIWQRVFAGPEEGPREDLRGLQMEAMELAAVYRALSAGLTGWQRERTRQLSQGEAANAASLGGMQRLSRLPGDAPKGAQPLREPAERTLEKCYHRTRRCMTEYMARSAQPEFGEVFRKLADREGQHCLWITELLGGIG